MKVQPAENSSQDSLTFGQCLAIRESQNLKTEVVQRHSATLICIHRFRLEVLTTIQLDDQLPFDAGEVREVTAHRLLAPELVAVEPSIAQGLPQTSFGIGRGFAQLTRPHPDPLPQAGEGTRRSV
jgi:hypothetical protein